MFKTIKYIVITIVFLSCAYFCESATSGDGGVVLRRCQPIQEQLTEANKSYIINKKINLKGQTINIPEGSTLVFLKKGKLVNGNIVGNQTKIQAGKRPVFEKITIDKSGTWHTNVSFPEWFGACDKKSIDSKMAIQQAVDVADTCVLSQRYFTSFDTPTGRGDNINLCAIEIKNTVLLGQNGNILYIDSKYSNTERTTVFYVENNVTIDGVNIEYLNEDHSGWTGTQAGVYRVDGGKFTIQNTTLRGAMAAWINLIGKPGRNGYVIKNNFVHDCDCGLIIQGNQHTNGEIYPIKILMEGNTIEKEKELHSEFVSFWGSCEDGGIVFYTDISIKNNHFSGGTKGGCIAGHPQNNGLKNVLITDNTFYDCGACSFYNTDGLVYKHNYVTGSTFVERQVKKLMGSYPNLAFYNCKNCTVDDNSCFGLNVENCGNMNIGKLKQTLGLKVDDLYFQQQPTYVTNFIGIRAKNSTISIDELTINPFEDENTSSGSCRYYINTLENSNVFVKKSISSIPIQVSAKGFSIKEIVFIQNADNDCFFIDTVNYE